MHANELQQSAGEDEAAARSDPRDKGFFHRAEPFAAKELDADGVIAGDRADAEAMESGDLFGGDKTTAILLNDAAYSG